MNAIVERLISEIKPAQSAAIALDFDGVCKLFTEHKHQIMSTLLFLHLPGFQELSLSEYKKAYGYINFHSKDYAGKARFLCVNALANYLADEKNVNCRLPQLDAAINQLEKEGKKLCATNLCQFSGQDDVKRLLTWSDEVDLRLTQLTGIGLTPGIKEHILEPFRQYVDFYLVSTATESSIKPSMEKEDIFFIKRYFGQETANKTDALTALVNAGYEHVFMFGDSVEDYRASVKAAKSTPEGVELLFVPVIPENEEESFVNGEKIIQFAFSKQQEAATKLAEECQKRFQGKEAGSQWKIN